MDKLKSHIEYLNKEDKRLTLENRALGRENKKLKDRENETQRKLESIRNSIIEELDKKKKLGIDNIEIGKSISKKQNEFNSQQKEIGKNLERLKLERREKEKELSELSTTKANLKKQEVKVKSSKRQIEKDKFDISLKDNDLDKERKQLIAKRLQIDGLLQEGQGVKDRLKLKEEKLSEKISAKEKETNELKKQNKEADLIKSNLLEKQKILDSEGKRLEDLQSDLDTEQSRLDSENDKLAGKKKSLDRETEAINVQKREARLLTLRAEKLIRDNKLEKEIKKLEKELSK